MQTRKKAFAAALVMLMACLGAGCWIVGREHSNRDLPEPGIVMPGANGQPPSDAIVLFDGRDLSQWNNGENWIIKDGVATVGAGKGGITTKRAFGDCQLHVEWASPSQVTGSGQERGNSGIYLQESYEVQVLDSYQNPTYFIGMAGSIYGQYPPLVNASRKPGEWQTYEIIFQSPHFDAQGRLIKPAYTTVLYNGVLIQNHVEIKGNTGSDPPAYKLHPDKMPLHLQDHGCPVRYRNIWIREL